MQVCWLKVTDIYEAMGNLSTKYSDIHTSYGTRIQLGKLKVESEKLSNLCGKCMSGRGENPGQNAP